MKYTTKAALTAALSQLSKSTVRMLAIEVKFAVHRRGRATDQVTAAQLASFLVDHPLDARKVAQFLARASKDPAHQPIVDALLGVKGAGEMQVGGWTLQPTDQPRVAVLTNTKGVKMWAERHTDSRVGLVILTRPDDTRVSQALFESLPLAVQAAVAVLLPEPEPGGR